MCPCYKETIEDTRHQLHCYDPNRKEIWEDSILELKKWMIENDTEPNLLHGIMTYIKGKGTIPFSDIIDIKWTIPNITDYRSNWLG